MADFLSSALEMDSDLDPGSIFQDNSLILQQLSFLENLTHHQHQQQQQQQQSSSVFEMPGTSGGGGGVGGMGASSNGPSTATARNSMKTLKCPKCNWHYKYQEALENHLKDKHPDVEITCVYCIQNLAHPKLARGESYSCGYKPFRCDVCNYSTTTKGNLSIHMQSDKHLHAMQELPNNIVTESPGLSSNDGNEDKTFQCLICGGYWTDSLEDLSEHLNVDRGQTHPADVSAAHGVFQCHLCPYTTNLKANFQLHMRTDKHVQRVQIINHMREGFFGNGSTTPNSNLLIRLGTVKSGVQIRCRPCCEVLSSPESLKEHCSSSSHHSRTSNSNSLNPSFVAVASALGLTSPDTDSAMDLSVDQNCDDLSSLFESSYQCKKCSFFTERFTEALGHCDSHPTDISDVLNVNLPLRDGIPEDQDELKQLIAMNEIKLKCDQCTSSSSSSKLPFLADTVESLESHLESHDNETLHSASEDEESPLLQSVNCPLCDESRSFDGLEPHLLEEHKITAEKAKKLMETAVPTISSHHGEPETSQIYKYSCVACPMVFKNKESYQKHALRHLFDSTHTCTRCNRTFKSQLSLKSHLIHKHGIYNTENLNEHKCSICDEMFESRSGLQSHIYSIDHLHKTKKFLEDQNQGSFGTKINVNEQVMNLLNKGSFGGETPEGIPGKPYKCNVCRLSYGQGSTLDIHLRSVAHQTRIGRLGELLAAGEVEAHLPVSEQPSGVPQKTIGELVLPTTKNEIEKLKSSNNPMDIASGSTTVDRKRKLDDESSLTAFRNIMNMSHLFNQFGENSENNPESLKQAFAAINSAELQNLLAGTLPQSSTSSVASSARATPLEEDLSDVPKTGRALRKLLETYGLDLVEQFYDKIRSVMVLVERLPDAVVSELSKVDCPNCNCVFPSLWVLKEHAQEVHSSSTPLESVQQFSEKLKAAIADLEEDAEPLRKQQKVDEISSNLGSSRVSNGKSTSPIKRSANGTSSPISNNSASEMSTAMSSNPLMMSMIQNNFPMMMNPFLSMMNSDMMSANSMMNGLSSNGSNPNDIAAALGNQRRARTKITDDQLRVLKQYFDINNSPTEQQVKEMSIKTGLAEKVIKHWFRNTLFKERQRDKDSPYNFNVPPQLSIDLDTYDKTGEAKVKPVLKEEIDDFSNRSTPLSATPVPQLEPMKAVYRQLSPKLEAKDSSTSAAALVSAASEFMANLNKAVNNNFVNPFALLSQVDKSSFQSMLSNHQNSRQSESPAPQSGGGSGGGRRANRTRFTDVQLRSLQQFFDKQAYPKDDDLEMLSKKLSLSPRVIVVWFQNARQKARKIYENTPNMDNNERFIRTPGQNFQCKRCSLVFPRYYELIQHQQKVCYINDNDAQNNDNKGVIEEPLSDEEKPTTSYEAGGTATVTPGAPLNFEDKNPMETLASLINGSASGMTYHPSEDASTDELMKLLTGNNSDVFSKFLKSERRESVGEAAAAVGRFQKRCPFCGILFNSRQKLQEHIPVKHPEQTLIAHVDVDQLPDAEDVPMLSGSSSGEQALDLSNISQSPLSPQSDNEDRIRRDSSVNFIDGDFDFSSVMSVSPLPSMLAGSLFGGTGGQQRSPSSTSGSNNQNSNKRYRTHLTPMQVYVMKALFNDYKTPSMTECDMLGNEIGLNKRVVQVWFQNARAKERKCRSVTGDEDLPKTAVDGCEVCGVQFSGGRTKTTMQDHIFTKRHMQLLSEKFSSKAGQGGGGGGEDMSMDMQSVHQDFVDKPRAKAVRDSGSRKILSRPGSAAPQFPFNLMYGLQSNNLSPLFCDPAIIGTPVTALQIPAAVMQQITADIQSGKDSTKFTQDGLELRDLQSKISEEDFRRATLMTTAVGYACLNCSSTFQQLPALEGHQKLICQNTDGKALTLLQNHYECISCNVKVGTQEEFKKHVESQSHQSKHPSILSNMETLVTSAT